MASIRLGDLLVKAKVITEAQLKTALAHQHRTGGKLGEVLVRLSIITEDMLVKALSKQLGIQSVNLDQVDNIAAGVRQKVDLDTAMDVGAIPLQLRDEGRTLLVGMVEPQNARHLETLRSLTGLRIVPQMVGRQSLNRALQRFYVPEVAPAKVGRALADELDSSFKLVDSQGHTLEKPVPVLMARPGAPTPQVNAPGSVNRPPQTPAAAVLSSKNPLETLRAIEEAQRKEVAALKAMVDVLIEKGIFTREEYLAKVKR